MGSQAVLRGLGSRDKVGGRNEIREAIRGEPLANQDIHSAAADYNLPFHASSQRADCNVVSGLGSLRNFVPSSLSDLTRRGCTL